MKIFYWQREYLEDWFRWRFFGGKKTRKVRAIQATMEVDRARFMGKRSGVVFGVNGFKYNYFDVAEYPLKHNGI